MYAEDDLIPLSALQHLLFCERQCALIHVEQVWNENLFTAEGRIMHERVYQVDRDEDRITCSPNGMFRGFRDTAMSKVSVVNISLTLRNWLIGCHIREYEQEGADRAEYRTSLLDARYQRLTKAGMKGVAARTLPQYRQFCLAYPQSWQTLSANSHDRLSTVLIWLCHPDSAFFATGWEDVLAILRKTSTKGGEP